MEIHELQQLLSEMSLQEKIGQMVQLTGAYFDKEAVLTGVVGEQLPPGMDHSICRFSAWSDR